MSTNTSNLPDVQELQRIANQLFKALPEEAPKEISLDPYKHPRAAALAQSVSGGGNPAIGLLFEWPGSTGDNPAHRITGISCGSTSHPAVVGWCRHFNSWGTGCQPGPFQARFQSGWDRLYTGQQLLHPGS